jgi:hypothetical protein
MVIYLKKNMIYIIVAVLIAVIVVGIAGFMLLNKGEDNNETTPTPTPGPNVADATSLQFSANVTSQGQTTEYKWYGTNLNSANVKLRVNFATYAYIFDTSQEKSWMSTDSGATWSAGTFATDWSFWGTQWTDYTSKLATWSGTGDVSYTNTAGEAIILFNIVVNPTIPDSTFATS